jgi:hypothetical protein
MNVQTMSRILLTIFILMLLIFVFGFRSGGYDILSWLTLIGCLLLLGLTWLPWQRWMKERSAKK